MNILQRNNVKVIGNGPKTLVFGHGFGCDQHIWNAVAPTFTSNYTVVLYDYVGSGNSDRNAFSEERYGNLEGYAQDLLEILGALNLEQVIFVAHSISGVIGYLAAIQEPQRFQQIIAIGPSACYIDHPNDNYQGGFSKDDIDSLLNMMEHNFYEWAGLLAPQAMANAENPQFANQLTERFRGNEPRMLQCFARATFYADFRNQLKELRVPVHILFARADVVVPRQAIDYQLQHIPACTSQELNATGHYPHISKPSEVIRALNEQLTK
ncbi:alpha/beta fold hydrolase [Aliidiomarina sp.]|uniref:alpha/beta fold hydrolase n=1 Tax=Aliidiomarina sp. TaxID=1872439 RepID=UPI003A4DD45C